MTALPPNGSPSTVAVVGTGYWGVNYIRLLAELPQVTRVIACDPQVEALASLAQRYPQIETVEQLSDLPEDVDAAIVCTPAKSHNSVASALLQRGIHLLVEKPFTEKSEDAIELMELARKRGLTVSVGHTFLHNPGVKMLHDLLESGRIGQLYYMYARRTNLGPIRSDVNALWDLAPHDISMFNYLLGRAPVSVSAVGLKALRSDKEDVGFISLTYPGNLVAHIHVSWIDPSKVREVVLVGQNCRVLFDDIDAVEHIRIFEKGVAPLAVEGGSFAEHALQITDGDIISPHIVWREPLREQVLDFFEAVAEGREPLSSGTVGLDVVRVMEAIDRSVAAQGTPMLVEGEGVEVGTDGTVIDIGSRAAQNVASQAAVSAGA